MSKWLALCLIRIYQRHLSPRKGFGCAYRAGTGRAGCSGLAFRAIRRYGLRRGGGIARARLSRCARAAREPAARLRQSGYCEPPPCGPDCLSPAHCDGCLDDAACRSGECLAHYWPGWRRNRRRKAVGADQAATVSSP
ncbi:membrane protein insertion efficiency factor YidD [Chromobacterium violaceum]|uniref:membrane protein insertion efficiency factor YidD n=1 Tax=Chromobacterium violaceum TaxID=536 RepID=UPI003CF007A8